MIHDARTHPRGWKLSIQEWPRFARVRQIARRLGYRIPSPSFVTPEATPARALLNHGVWRAWCPDCPYAAEDVWRGFDLFWCMKCGNASAGNAWRPLIWPENLAEIEANLDPFPPQAQNWEPWGEAVDYIAVAQDWVDHAGPMVDPEHGLTDNEVGGEDDPETYTTPALAVTNEIITSSDANADKGDIRYFRQFLSNNPGGANYLPISSSANAGSWVAGATAVPAALGYTPVNKAGDTLTGQMVFGATAGVTFRGNGGATPSSVRDYAAQGLVIAAHNDEVEIWDQALANLIGRFYRSSGVSHGLIGGSEIYTAANAGAFVPSGLIAAFTTAASIAAGWGRYTNLDGRVPVGDGTVAGVTWVENTAYGSSWSHLHTMGAHTHLGPSHTHTGPSHSHGLSAAGIGGTMGGPGGAVNTTGGTGNTSADGSHTHSLGSLDVTGTTDADGTGATGAAGTGQTAAPSSNNSDSTAWVIPSFAIVWAQKS